MKLQLTILIIAAIVAIASAACTEKQWADYKKKFNKVYNVQQEDRDHYYTFCDTKRDIAELTSDFKVGETSLALSLTVYSDLTPSEREEYNKKHGIGASDKKRRRGKTTTTAKPEAEEYDEEE